MVVAATGDKTQKTPHSVVMFSDAEMTPKTDFLNHFFDDFRLFVTFVNQKSIAAAKAFKTIAGEYILAMHMSMAFSKKNPS